MLFAGTYVTSGRGKGVVVAVGLQTQIGKIAEMLAQKSNVKIPLIERLERFSKNIAIAVTVASVFLFFIALYCHMEIAEIFFLILALFVSAATEGLGSCTIIATDKTA